MDLGLIYVICILCDYVLDLKFTLYHNIIIVACTHYTILLNLSQWFYFC